MDIGKIKEDLSMCYLQTITVINGIAFDRTIHDEDSTDVILRKIVEVGNNKFNATIRVQLKSTSSTSQYSISNEYITYKLKVKNYNDLCADSTTPIILALLLLPENQNEWVKWSEEELLIKGTMYWLSLQKSTFSDNTDTVSVKIPIKNKLNNFTVENVIKKLIKEMYL